MRPNPAIHQMIPYITEDEITCYPGYFPFYYIGRQECPELPGNQFKGFLLVFYNDVKRIGYCSGRAKFLAPAAPPLTNIAPLIESIHDKTLSGNQRIARTNF